VKLLFADNLIRLPVWETRRLWSLRDMINFQLRSYIDALEHLDVAKNRARSRHEDDPLHDGIRQLIAIDVQPIHEHVVGLGMTTAFPRMSRLTVVLQVACTRFRRHRVRCFYGTGGESWRDDGLHESSSLRRCG
jgi:hypothetical protein